MVKSQTAVRDRTSQVFWRSHRPFPADRRGGLAGDPGTLLAPNLARLLAGDEPRAPTCDIQDRFTQPVSVCGPVSKLRPFPVRLALALAGSAALFAPAAFADPHGGHGRGHGGYEMGDERSPPGRGPEGRGPPGHYDRDGGRVDRSWDGRRYNGYYLGPRWYSGAPPAPVFDDPTYRPGFTPWRRGAFLPSQYHGYVVQDFDRYHLRRPPYGYSWIQAGDQFLLVSMSTGQIFDVVTGF